VQKTPEDALLRGLEAQWTVVASQEKVPVAIRSRLFRSKLRVPVATR
jgi:hypothetical protein